MSEIAGGCNAMVTKQCLFLEVGRFKVLELEWIYRIAPAVTDYRSAKFSSSEIKLIYSMCFFFIKEYFCP